MLPLLLVMPDEDDDSAYDVILVGAQGKGGGGFGGNILNLCYSLNLCLCLSLVWTELEARL